MTPTAFAEPGAIPSAPANGVITSWKAAGVAGGPFTFQVVHSLSPTLFDSTAGTSTGAVSGPATITVPANVPIAKGDFIGIDPTSSSDTVAGTIGGSSKYMLFGSKLGSAGASPTNTFSGEVGIQAQVLLNCTVPNLKGRKIGKARNKLAAAGCAAPKVKKKGGKFVKKQNPQAGTEIRGDAVVTLKAGPKKQ